MAYFGWFYGAIFIFLNVKPKALKIHLTVDVMNRSQQQIVIIFSVCSNCSNSIGIQATAIYVSHSLNDTSQEAKRFILVQCSHYLNSYNWTTQWEIIASLLGALWMNFTISTASTTEAQCMCIRGQGKSGKVFLDDPHPCLIIETLLVADFTLTYTAHYWYGTDNFQLYVDVWKQFYRMLWSWQKQSLPGIDTVNNCIYQRSPKDFYDRYHCSFIATTVVAQFLALAEIVMISCQYVHFNNVVVVINHHSETAELKNFS
jgi:hypothetical protein